MLHRGSNCSLARAMDGRIMRCGLAVISSCQSAAAVKIVKHCWACVDQWRTEEGVRLGGLEPLPLAYDLRNKRVRMRQNMAFSTKNTKNFLVRGTAPSPDSSSSGEGDTPYPRLTLSVPEAPRLLPF